MNGLSLELTGYIEAGARFVPFERASGRAWFRKFLRTNRIVGTGNDGFAEGGKGVEAVQASRTRRAHRVGLIPWAEASRLRSRHRYAMSSLRATPATIAHGGWGISRLRGWRCWEAASLPRRRGCVKNPA